MMELQAQVQKKLEEDEKWEQQEKKRMFKEELDAQMNQVKTRMQINDMQRYNPTERQLLEKSALVIDDN